MAGGEGAEARKRLEPAGGSEVAREAAGRVAAPGHAAGRGRAGVAASLGFWTLEAAGRRHGSGAVGGSYACTSTTAAAVASHSQLEARPGRWIASTS